MPSNQNNAMAEDQKQTIDPAQIQQNLLDLIEITSAMNKKMATKDDLTPFATKNDLDVIKKTMATKDDLLSFATKDDLLRFATKDDLTPFATKNDLVDLKTDLKSELLAKDEFYQFKNEMVTKQDQILGIIRRTDEERLFTNHRLEGHEQKIKEHDEEIKSIKIHLGATP